MARMVLSLALAPLVACTTATGTAPYSPGGGEVGVDDTGVEEADGDTDTDTDADTDADADADAEPDLVFNGEGVLVGKTLTLVGGDPAFLTGVDGAEPSFGASIATVLCTEDPCGVVLGDVPEDQLLEDPNNEDYFFAMFVPAIFDDDNDNGTLDEDEYYAGVGLSFGLYATGSIPEREEGAGVIEGWNVFERHYDNTESVYGDPADVPIGDQLELDEEITIGGSFTNVGVGMIITLFPMVMGGDMAPDSPPDFLVQELGSDPWEISLDARPGDEHFAPDPSLGLDLAYELPLAFLEVDGVDGYDPAADTAIGQACTPAEPPAIAALVYIPPITEISLALVLAPATMHAGWNAVQVGEGITGLVPVPPDELTALAMGGACGDNAPAGP
jgi:hypothetical protein